MAEISNWLEQTKSRATALSGAYQRRLANLWWANLMFVVLPALFSTAAAIVAALPPGEVFVVFSLPVASVLAGGAAILTTIHKALKCDEHQDECLRLSQAYQSVAIAAESALSWPDEEQAAQQKQLTSELENLSMNAKALVSANFMNSAGKAT